VLKYSEEYRNPKLVGPLVERIRAHALRPMRFMEFCGGHTHAIMRYGLRPLVAPAVELVSGPGCPVCVTSSADLDRAIALAETPDLILATFGDMLRVPGSRESLQEAQARGADVRMVYSSLDALDLARRNPDRPVAMLGVGFETTAPTIAASILRADQDKLDNFFALSLHKLTPPATRAILDAGEVHLDGIIGPGHVTTIIGQDAWNFLPEEYGLSCAISGFEPLDMLQAIGDLVELVASAQPAVRNPYSRSVAGRGNPVAVEIMCRVFQVADADWRGLGVVPNSGLVFRDEFARFDAARAFDVAVRPSAEPKGCRCGEVLRGVMRPTECPLFARACDPSHPVGPCMVSAEGACAAYYLYREEEP
jgi:hydrogenase expression/formation protein HypD